MDSLLEAVKVVKTPTLPRDDEEDCGCPADLRLAALDRSRRPVTIRSGVDGYLISPERSETSAGQDKATGQSDPRPRDS